MLEWLVHNLEGYVEVMLHGCLPERFFNLCSLQGLGIWRLRCGKDGAYCFFMTVRDFRKVRPLVRKSHVSLRIMKRRGLPFFIDRNKKRGAYAAGIAAFFLILFSMSLFVWDIQMEGNRYYTQDTLLRYLNSREIRYGMRKSEINCDELEAWLRTDFPEIIWVSAQLSGTRLLLHIKENEVLSQGQEGWEGPSDLIAEKSGRITSVAVRRGIAKVKAGEEVEKGQLLVSGRIPITGEDEEEIKAYFVAAQGEVYAETCWSYDYRIPAVRTVRADTGKRRRGLYLKAGPWHLHLMMPAMGKNSWDFFAEEHQLRLFSDFYLPVYVGNIEAREMASYEKAYTKAELLELSSRINRQFVKKLEEKGVQILENNDRIERSVSGYRMKGEFVTEESIIHRQPLPENAAEERMTVQ